MKDDLEVFYKNEQRTKNLIAFGTVLIVFIACLGLFGLASFTVEQRSKEIVIRKVLGASLSSIAALLSKKLLTWIILANIMAWPTAFFIIKKWLQNFAYQVGFGIEIFIFSALVAFFIASLTISVQTIKAATANPINVLRRE